MANVTYLLGAGASYNALPIVDELPDAINNVITSLSRHSLLITSGHSEIFTYYTSYQNNAINNLRKLLEGCLNHLSIDTYAKMLFLTGNQEYTQIKATIGLFFKLHSFFAQNKEVIFRTTNESKKGRQTEYLDKRYDAFFASILQERYDMFPNNIKVLSWNYDNQFENTFKRYIKNANKDTPVEELLNVYRKGHHNKDFDTAGFGIYKINGSVGYITDVHQSGIGVYQQYIDHFGETDELMLFDILKTYNEGLGNNMLRTNLSFAWESNPEDDKFIVKARKATTLSEILVVIGYSFPFFNRKTDSIFFNKNSMHYLKKIYVQDSNADEVIERIKSIRPPHEEPNLKYIPIYNTRQFYLPSEL